MARPRIAVPILLVVLAAGCSQPDPGVATTDQPSRETRTTDDAVRDGSRTSNENTESGFATIEPGERLSIYSETNENLSISLYEYTGSEPRPNSTETEPASWRLVDSVTYTDPRGSFGVTEFEPDGQIVIELNDRVVWERQIEPFERYRLSISETGEVTVTDHWIY